MRIRALVVTMCALAIASCASPLQNDSGPVPRPAAPASVRQAHWVRTSLGKFGDPYGVAVNPSCASACPIYVADPGHKIAYKVQPDGSRSPIGTFGDPTFDPVGVAVSVDHTTGNDVIWVADRATHGESKIWDVRDGVPRICCDGENSYVAGRPLYNRGIAVYAPKHAGGNPVFAAYAAQASHLPLTAKGRVECQIHFATCHFTALPFSDPYGVAVDGNGALYVADARDKKAYRVIRGSAVDLGKTFADPYGIAATLDGSTVFVADAGDKNVWERNSAGDWSVVDRFADPYGVAVDASGALYVADPGSKEVWRLTR